MASQTFTKLGEIEHVLKRPDTFVGSLTKKKRMEYVVVDDSFHIEKKEIQISKAFARIFIEPLSNCIDNVAVSRQNGIKVSKIHVSIDKETGETTFLNDGNYIPIEIHEEEKVYKHTLVFGHLRTSSNYDDDKVREDISGRNGYGIKLSNIFSTKFTVEAVDPKNGKILTQTWENNMSKVHKPKIKSM